MQWSKFDYHLSEFFYYANVIAIAQDAKKNTQNDWSEEGEGKSNQYGIA